MKDELKALLFNSYKIVFKIMGFILPKNNKIIVFESFLGKQYSDNPRAIYEHIKEEYPSYKLYWSFDKAVYNSFSELSLKKLKRFSLKWLITMNRAKYWVSNSRMPLWIPKPRNTIYIQTWHGTPLKKLAVDMEKVYMPGTNTENYKKNFLKESAKWDYLISPNEYSTKIFRRAFAFEKEVLETGYPRNDFLVQKDNSKDIQRIKSMINLPANKKILLYAPTWRDNQYYNVGKYKFNIPMDLKEVQKELSDDYIILLRTHYLVSENLDLKEFNEFVYDVSKYEDIRDLYIISDMLITDYSSVFFDYANLKRPMIFYVYDLEEYRDKLRGFYFDFEKDAPGPLIKTTNELIKVIKQYEEGFYISEKVKQFYGKYCYLEDGESTSRVVKRILKNNE